MKQRAWLYVFSIIAMAVLKAMLDVVTSRFVNRTYSLFELHNYSTILTEAGKSILTGAVLILIWRFFTIFYNNEAKRVTAALQKQVYQKALLLPLTFYENEEQGNFLSRLSYNINKAADVYGSRFRRVVSPFISVLVYLTAMFSLNWKISALLLAADILLLFLNLAINKPMKQISELLLKIKAQETGILLNLLHGAETIRLYDLKQNMQKRCESALLYWQKKQSLRNILTAVLECFHSGFDLLCSVLFLGIGIFLINAQSIQLGELVAIYVLYTSFHFLQIGKYIPELTECLVYMNDLFEFLALEEENDYLGQNIEKIQSKDLSMPTAVSLADISFGYANGQTIINHLSVSFENGKMTAITGRTGCGKSTLLKLICGFYPVTGGEIFLFGKKLSEIGYEEARRQIAYVPQEPYLYQTTIEENIAYGKPGTSTEEIMNAARAANAHEFILKQPQGYRTLIREGGRNLSGGERQRIAIARAILKDAPIILMDEATSALDNASEKSINDFLQNTKHKKTIIIVAHRPETIERADIQVEIS